jgi:hypothetical protein
MQPAAGGGSAGAIGGFFCHSSILAIRVDDSPHPLTMSLLAGSSRIRFSFAPNFDKKPPERMDPTRKIKYTTKIFTAFLKLSSFLNV